MRFSTFLGCLLILIGAAMFTLSLHLLKAPWSGGCQVGSLLYAASMPIASFGVVLLILTSDV